MRVIDFHLFSPHAIDCFYYLRIVGTPEAQLLAKHELEMLLKTQVLTVAQYSSSGGMVQAGMMWGGGASVPGMAMQTPAGYYGLQNPQQNGSMYPGYDMGNAGGGATGAGVPGYFGAVPPNPGAGVAASPYGVAMMGGVPSQAYPYGQGDYFHQFYCLFKPFFF